MSLIDSINVVRNTLPRHQAHYEGARTRRPELAPYATPAAVVEALDASSTLTAPQRYLLLAALGDEHAKGPAPLWGALLLVAFTPLLLRIRTRLRFPEDEERDQRVLVAFFSAIASPGVRGAGEYVAVAVSRATMKALVAEGAKDRGVEVVAFDEELHSGWDKDAISEAELRIEAFWAARRAERAMAHVRTHQQHGLESPSLNTAMMLDRHQTVLTLAPLVTRLQKTSKRVSNESFNAQCDAWSMGLQFYSLLQRRAKTDGELAANLEPIGQMFAYRHPVVKATKATKMQTRAKANLKKAVALATKHGVELDGGAVQAHVAASAPTAPVAAQVAPGVSAPAAPVVVSAPVAAAPASQPVAPAAAPPAAAPVGNGATPVASGTNGAGTPSH